MSVRGRSGVHGTAAGSGVRFLSAPGTAVKTVSLYSWWSTMNPVLCTGWPA